MNTVLENRKITASSRILGESDRRAVPGKFHELPASTAAILAKETPPTPAAVAGWRQKLLVLCEVARELIAERNASPSGFDCAWPRCCAS
jgi:hypothetical protein